MKTFLLSTLTLLAVLLISTSAFAGSRKVYTPISCPAVIANTITEEYERLRTKSYLCFKSYKDAIKYRAINHIKTPWEKKFVCNGAPLGLDPELDIDGIGTLENTPPFQVLNTPRVLSYNYEGKGGFSVKLYNSATNKFVDTVVSISGNADSATEGIVHLNYPGVFFLKITGSSSCDRDGLCDGDWNVKVE